MANRKISDLTALTAPATGDLLPIVDISEAVAADKNKKITYGELLSSAPAGSAAAPSFSFDGDPNSGLYSAGADQVAISTGGSGRLFVDALRITSAGLVGVGSSSPWSLMSVGNSGTVGDVTSARQISVGLSTNYNVSFGYYQTAAASAFAGVIQAIDGAVGTPLLLNPSGGRVGIGTSSPQSILNLSSTGPVITLTRSNSPDAGSGAINFATSDNTVRWQVGTNQAVGAGLEINRGAGTNNAVYIDTSNRVGIGTTGPQAIFHSKAGATTSAGIFESTSASGSFLSFADTGTNS
jgi:hypothetical protein